jgi:hypothetical protein
MSRLEKAKKWKGIEHMKTPSKRFEVDPQQSPNKRQKSSICDHVHSPRAFYPNQSVSPHLVPESSLDDGKLPPHSVFQMPSRKFGPLTGEPLPPLMASSDAISQATSAYWVIWMLAPFSLVGL